MRENIQFNPSDEYVKPNQPQHSEWISLHSVSAADDIHATKTVSEGSISSV